MGKLSGNSSLPQLRIVTCDRGGVLSGLRGRAGDNDGTKIVPRREPVGPSRPAGAPVRFRERERRVHCGGSHSLCGIVIISIGEAVLSFSQASAGAAAGSARPDVRREERS